MAFIKYNKTCADGLNWRFSARILELEKKFAREKKFWGKNFAQNPEKKINNSSIAAEPPSRA